MLTAFVEALMSAETDIVCAGFNTALSRRTAATATGPGSGDTCAGTADLAILNLREDSYFLKQAAEAAQGAERATTSLSATLLPALKLTRRLENLVESAMSPGCRRLRVTGLAKDLGEQVERFPSRRCTRALTRLSRRVR